MLTFVLATIGAVVVEGLDLFEFSTGVPLLTGARSEDPAGILTESGVTEVTVPLTTQA